MSTYKKHYLLTGGAGFIGSHLVRALLGDKDLRITCIDNFDPFYPRQVKLLNTEDFVKHLQVTMFDRNLEDLSVHELKMILPQPVDVIIHLAAKAGVRPSIADPMAYQRTAATPTPPGPSPRVLPGGSYLCHNSYSNRYRNSARSSNTPDSSMGYTGFRTVAR